MTRFFLKLAGLVAVLAVFGFGAALAQVTITYNGILSVVWGDPQPGFAGGGTLFTLTEPNGTNHPLEIAPDQQPSAIQLFGKRVTVRGRANERAALGPSTIVVDEISSAEPARAAPERLTLTTKKALIILLKFKNDPQQPHPISFYANLFNKMTPPAGSTTPTTINQFFDKVSWGQLKFAATVAKNKWFTLPGVKTSYAPCNAFSDFSPQCTANIIQIAQDAMALAVAAGVNVAAYETINFVLNNDLDCCAWGGGFTFSGQFYNATWEPPWAQHAETYVHELGHSLGLPHSGWNYYDYDSPWDIMSMHNMLNGILCGTYNSLNSNNSNRQIVCPEPGSGYIVAHKNFLGWIPAANQVVIDQKILRPGRNINLSDSASALGSTKKMIKICLVGEDCSVHFLTVEVKMASKVYDRGVPHNGVVIHDVLMTRRNTISGPCYRNNQSGWAMPIDATPGDFNSTTCTPKDFQGATSGSEGLGNAQFNVGETYTDVAHGIKIKVKSQSATGFVVNVIRSK